MKVSLDVIPWKGEREVSTAEAQALVVDKYYVDGRRLHGATLASLEVDPHGGFLVLRVEGASNVWTPDEYLEGSEPAEGLYLLPVSNLYVREVSYAVSE